MSTGSDSELSAPVDNQVASRLLERTAELVSIPSVSRNEKQIADYVCNTIDAHMQEIEANLGSIELLCLDGDNVVCRTSGNREKRIVIASHLDTVPPAGPDTGTAGTGAGMPSRTYVEDGTLYGLGAVDTKGSVAIMLDLLIFGQPPPVEMTFVFYSCEEVSRNENGLRQILQARPDLLQGDVAIVGEPSGGNVEAGCQTTVTATITLEGRRAHTARPWMGANAIHLLAPVVDRIAHYSENVVELDGCMFREQLQAVAIHGGVASNIVPDVASIVVNHRAAPHRNRSELERWLVDSLIQDTPGSLAIDDYAQGSLPSLSNPWLDKLVALTGRPPRAKLGWTDVATFAEAGIAACNFGPGDPELAHTPYERVSAVELANVRSVLASLITPSS
ncbi:MAG: succinyl-diaminopimelate desuccinylase [Acidimicrobiales bacterium]